LKADWAVSKEIFPVPREKLRREDFKAALPDIKGIFGLLTVADWKTGMSICRPYARPKFSLLE
jgi:hypothetical protein